MRTGDILPWSLSLYPFTGLFVKSALLLIVLALLLPLIVLLWGVVLVGDTEPALLAALAVFHLKPLVDLIVWPGLI